MAMVREGPILLEDGWRSMEEGIQRMKRILEGEQAEAFDSKHFMRLYTLIYNMCTQKPPCDHSEALYARYRRSIESYVSERVLPALRQTQDEGLLRELTKRWERHGVLVRWLSRFFQYLDRYFVQRQSLSSLKNVGLQVWRDGVYAEFHAKARDATLRAVEAERRGEPADWALLKNALSIFQEVGMGTLKRYEEDFEAALLEQSREYYRRAALAWSEEGDGVGFLVRAEEALRAEEERVNHYLHLSTKPKLLLQVETELLSKHQTSLLENAQGGCTALLKAGRKFDLTRMYRLFGRIPNGLNPMAVMFEKHVEEEGMRLVREAGQAAEARKAKEVEGAPPRGSKSGPTPEHQFIRSVVDTHDAYGAYVSECFGNSSLFHKSLKEAFETFCNKQVAGAPVAELLASFCDGVLKKGGAERVGEEELEGLLDRAVRLLSYVSDKDLFSEFYRKKLAKRLLFTQTASEEHERAVLTRLKQQCGAQFTSKMEGMVNDLQLAREKERGFQDWRVGQAASPALDLSVTVLTTGFWPTYKSLDLALPEEMMASLEQFSRFHDETTNKTRRLTWQLSLGTVHLRAQYDKAYEILVQPMQAAVLLALQTQDRMPYDALQAATRLPPEDLDRALGSLALGKHKLLDKEPAGRRIGRQDVFFVNSKFSDRMRRIRIPLPPVDDRKKVQEEVDKDRKYAIDAAIVRIMKSRKTLSHSNLIAEVVQQLGRMFQADVRVIKRSIEGLIDREYLERDENNHNQYCYVV